MKPVDLVVGIAEEPTISPLFIDPHAVRGQRILDIEHFVGTGPVFQVKSVNLLLASVKKPTMFPLSSIPRTAVKTEPGGSMLVKRPA